MGSDPANDLTRRECLPEDKPVPKPEDYIGSLVGSTHKIDSVLAIGSKFVVFKTRNLKTGEVDQVAKILLEVFDPRTPLLAAMHEVMAGVGHNPERVIRLCDRLLLLDPNMEAAVFNKGVALIAKKDYGAALEAFNSALNLLPGDQLNLVHRSACFAMLGKDAESLCDLHSASTMGADQLRKTLSIVRPLASAIRHALVRQLQSKQNSQVAHQMLRKYYGPFMRLRSLFSRFF